MTYETILYEPVRPKAPPSERPSRDHVIVARDRGSETR